MCDVFVGEYVPTPCGGPAHTYPPPPSPPPPAEVVKSTTTSEEARKNPKAQFYLVEYFPMTLQASISANRVVPPFKWAIAILSDVRTHAPPA